MSWTLIIGTLAALALVFPVIWTFVLQAYQKKRILTLFDPESDALGAGWNIIQSRQHWFRWYDRVRFRSGTQSQLGYLPEHQALTLLCRPMQKNLDLLVFSSVCTPTPQSFLDV